MNTCWGWVTCPECKGRRRMYYREPEPFAPLPHGEVSMDGVAVAYEQPCRVCDGKGRVKATEPTAVYQHGMKIGTVPPGFDPARIKSTSPWYSPRPGDFVRDGDHWVAARTLGPGDLEAVPGFVWDRSHWPGGGEG
jgi:hypothetical protein